MRKYAQNMHKHAIIRSITFTKKTNFIQNLLI
jgi:hypothetical protein